MSKLRSLRDTELCGLVSESLRFLGSSKIEAHAQGAVKHPSGFGLGRGGRKAQVVWRE